jgi:dsRNA-specific ribonuclease
VSRIHGVKVSSKLAHHAESKGAPNWAAVARQRGPGQREFNAHHVCALFFAERNELGEQSARSIKSVTERATNAKILVEQWV